MRTPPHLVASLSRGAPSAAAGLAAAGLAAGQVAGQVAGQATVSGGGGCAPTWLPASFRAAPLAGDSPQNGGWGGDGWGVSQGGGGGWVGGSSTTLLDRALGLSQALSLRLALLRAAGPRDQLRRSVRGTRMN